MANQADATLIFDTEIDSVGFTKDSDELKKAVKSLNNKIEQLGPTFQKALTGNVSAISTFKGKAASLSDTISELEKKMSLMKDETYPTAEYTHAQQEIQKTEQALQSLHKKEEELKASGKNTTLSEEYTWTQKELQKANKELERLQAKQSKMEATGVSPRSNQWKTLAYDMQLAEEKVQEYTNEIERLKASGDVTNEAIEWQKIQQSIKAAENELSQLQAKKNELESTGSGFVKGSDTQTYADIGKQVDEAKSKLAQMNSQIKSGNKFASSLKNSLSKAAGVARGALKKGVSLIEKGIKGAGKSAEGMHKKLLKAGIALLGMRGIMEGLKQIVSSALNNNEQLQNQLNAVKGMLGQALVPIINILIKGLATVITFADRLYSIFTGVSLISKYNAQQTAKTSSGLGTAAKNASKLKRQLAGFDELNVLSDNENDSSSGEGGGVDIATFKPAELSKEMQDFIKQFKELWSNGDFDGIGALISSKIVSALQGIDWENIKKKGFKGGKSFAELLNGLFEYSDSDGNTLISSISKTVGESFNTLLSVVDGFAANLHWGNLGSELANGISTAITTIDWKLLFKTAIDLGGGFGEYINGIFEYKDKDGNSLAKNLATGLSNAIHTAFLLVSSFVTTVNWQSIGKSIAEFIQGIDWVQLFDDLITLISDLCVALLDACVGLIEGMDWGKAVNDLFAIIGKLFTSVDWAGLASKLSRLLGDLVGASLKALAQITIDIADFVQKVIDSITGYFSQYFSWNDEPKDIVEGLLKGIVDAINGIGKWIYDNMIKPFIDGVKAGFGIHSPSTVMAEIGGYLIEGLKNGIGNIWNKIKENFDTFKTNLSNWFTNKAESFKSLGSKVITNVKSGIGGIWSKVTSNFTSFYSSVSSWFSGKSSSFNSLGSKAINNIKAGIGGIWSKFSGNFTSFYSSISSWFSGKSSSFQNLGKNIIAGIKTGINKKIGEIKTALTNGLSSALTSVKKLLGIHSPSRVFRDEVGQFIALGVGEGITGNMSAVVKDTATLAEAIQDELNNNDYVLKPIDTDVTQSANDSMNNFVNIITDGFNDLISKLEAIANGVTFAVPKAVNIVPYSNTSNPVDIKDIIHSENQTLISILVQLFTRQDNELERLIEVIKSLDLSVDERTITNKVIDEINRRRRVSGVNELLL